MLSHLFLSLIFLVSIIRADPTRDVQIISATGNATIRGYQHTYGSSYRGIRYASPPVGSLRFREAQLLNPSGLITALSYGKTCVQGDGVGSSEDCLFLNIFTPNNVTSKDRLPIYFYIHGGGFVEGSGNMGTGIYPNLVNKGKIIMITINYRLGPYGFFTTRDSLAPGNWAISDWITALTWVKKNIRFFGGDENRITIGGQSSGAEAVSILSLVSQANDLFKQMIMESGSAFGAAIMSYSENTRDTSEAISVKLGCATTSSWETGTNFGPILNCLRGATSAQITAADRSLPNHRMKWSIVQDKKYLPERLEYLALKRQPKPVLLGDVHDEELGGQLNYIRHNLNSTHNTATRVRTDLDNSYEMSYWNQKSAITIAANNKYINNQGWDENDYGNWEARRIQIWSEMIFIGPVLRDAKYFFYTKSNVYLYSLDWLSPNALPDITDPRFRGCMHTWELQYIFDTNCRNYQCTSEDNLLREYFTSTWLNFIKYGNPTPAGSSLPFKWLTFDKRDRFLSFIPHPVMKDNFHPDSTFFACSAPTLDGFKPPYC